SSAGSRTGQPPKHTSRQYAIVRSAHSGGSDIRRWSVPSASSATTDLPRSELDKPCFPLHKLLARPPSSTSAFDNQSSDTSARTRRSPRAPQGAPHTPGMVRLLDPPGSHAVAIRSTRYGEPQGLPAYDALASLNVAWFV